MNDHENVDVRNVTKCLITKYYNCILKEKMSQNMLQNVTNLGEKKLVMKTVYMRNVTNMP